MNLAELDVAGVLATKRLSVRQLVALKVGDVLPIDVPAKTPLHVEGLPLFEGDFGLHKGKNAVKITRITPMAGTKPRAN
jgi:flagellar motor switch protein FliM